MFLFNQNETNLMASYSAFIPFKRETVISLCFAFYMIAIRTVSTVKRIGSPNKVKKQFIELKEMVL
ncbi:MAG: hypothetical protein ACMG6E_09740 [Candidatus Roizmanbacteria bacterium]